MAKWETSQELFRSSIHSAKVYRGSGMCQALVLGIKWGQKEKEFCSHGAYGQRRGGVVGWIRIQLPTATVV